MNTRNLVTAFYALGAFTLWVGADTFIKLSGGALSIAQQIAINLFVASLIYLGVSLRGRGLRELTTKKPLFHVARGLIGLVNCFGVYYAVTHMPLANFYTIAFTLPLMIALASFLMFGERPGLGVWLAIVAGFLGVVITVNVLNYDATAWPWLGVASLIGGNMAAALYALTIRWGGKTESDIALTFYADMTAVIVCSFAVFSNLDWLHNLTALAYIVLAGALNGAATLLYTAAYRRTAKNALVAPFHYTQIVTGSVVGYAIWGDLPTPYLIVGAVIIIASGLYVMWRGAAQPTRRGTAEATP